MAYFFVSMPYFVVWILWPPELQTYSQRVYGFSINLKILFMVSVDKPILTLKTSVTNVCRFQYFADFNIKIVLLCQNSSEWIALSWVLCILNLHLNSKPSVSQNVWRLSEMTLCKHLANIYLCLNFALPASIKYFWTF